MEFCEAGSDPAEVRRSRECEEQDATDSDAVRQGKAAE